MKNSIEKDNKIGIIDFDLISTKKLCNYNFGVLLLSSYYLEQGIKPRLIVDISLDNLKTYDKIYIFKDFKTPILPINMIEGYYSLPIEEYGNGFKNKKEYPELYGIDYTIVNTNIYKPLLYYIEQGGKLFKDCRKEPNNSQHTRFFLQEENEVLIRDLRNSGKFVVYDDPLLFFSTDIGIKKMTKIIKNGKIYFVKPINISKIKPEFYSLLFESRRFPNIKKNLYAIDSDEYLKDFIEWVFKENLSISLPIKTKDGIKWFKKTGGKIYGNYEIRTINGTRAKNFTTKEDISIRREWIATKRLIKSNKFNRGRIREKEREKYLPSEIEKSRYNNSGRYRAIKKGR